MAQQWRKETPGTREQGRIVRDRDYEYREQVVEHDLIARHENLSKISSLIWLAFGILIALIGIRFLLLLLAANPANPFANAVYAFTEPFLWPFAGLFTEPAFNGMVLEFSSLIAMIVYALLAWIIVRLVWLIFHRTPTRTVSYEERDRT
jgi:YggT family protein